MEADQGLFELDFLVDHKQTDIQSPEFKSEVEKALGDALTNIAAKQWARLRQGSLPTRRRKRSVPIRVRIKNVEPDEYGLNG